MTIDVLPSLAAGLALLLLVAVVAAFVHRIGRF